MTTPSRVVIVGASIGGLTAAETLRQEGYGGEIVVLGDEPHLPYTRPPLSKQILLGEWEPHQAAIRTATELDDLAIDVRPGAPATGLDVDRRVVHTAAGDLAFDELVIATGSEPRRHPRLPFAPTLRTLADALALRDRLRGARRIAVVGSGILGSEIASAARKHGLEALLVGRSTALGFGGVGTLLSDPLAALHTAHGVELARGAEVVDARRGADGDDLVLSDGSRHRVDLTVAMIGGTPRTGWLAGSGLDLRDGVVCDERGAAAAGISAVGDVAAWRDAVTGRPVRVEHQSNAIEQAISVAVRIARGATSEPPTPLFWSEIHGTRIHAYGWFDPRHPLVALDADGAPRAEAADDLGAPVVYGSVDDTGRTRGVVGWNAPPRLFRAARASVMIPSPSLTTPS